MPYKIQKSGDKHCVVKEGGKQVACHDTRPEALKQMKALYANEKADAAHELRPAIPCCEQECERAFLSFDKMVDHAEAVHTFSDIERLVSAEVRERYGVQGIEYKNSIYTWIVDIAEDWVVFSVEASASNKLYQASYSIADGAVTLGDPVEVRRRTVYEPVKAGS